MPKDKKEKAADDCAEHVTELRKLVTLNTSVLELSEAEQKWCDDACLKRYLRAYEGKVDKAWKQLQETIAWRREMGVADLVANHLDIMKSDSKCGKLYVTPYKTKEGHPIICMHPAREDIKTRTHDNSLRLLVHNLEAAIARMGPGVEKWVILISFVKYSVMRAPPMKTSKATLNILMNHYPERLHKAFCCDAPWVFWAFWGAISPFIHPVTKAKVAILRMKNEKVREKIAELVEYDQFGPAFYGDGEYDLQLEDLHEQYWTNVVKNTNGGQTLQQGEEQVEAVEGEEEESKQQQQQQQQQQESEEGKDDPNHVRENAAEVASLPPLPAAEE